MGIINKLSKRCIFCKSKVGTKYVQAYGFYGETCAGNWYHDECLAEIACNPEKYGHRTVDMAIDIIDRVKTAKKNEDYRKKIAKDRCEYLRKQCI